MTGRQNWQTAFLNQARVDWEAYQKTRLEMWPECHQLLFLQMASEKLAKALLVAGHSSLVIRLRQTPQGLQLLKHIEIFLKRFDELFT